MAYISPEIGMVAARQARQGRERIERAKERAQQRYAGREASEGPTEDLQCPQCQALFAFGSDCPDCQVHLQPSIEGYGPPTW